VAESEYQYVRGMARFTTLDTVIGRLGSAALFFAVISRGSPTTAWISILVLRLCVVVFAWEALIFVSVQVISAAP
jgi:hypothetical protein